MSAAEEISAALARNDGVGDHRADNGHDDADDDLRHPILHG